MRDFDPRRDHRYTGRNDQVLKLVPEGASTALDVGCGCGGTAAELLRLGVSVDGITWSKEEAEEARNCCRSVEIADVANGLPLSVTGPYDLVICSHLLEHIAYPQRLLGDIFKVLRPGGFFIVAIPNVFFWQDRLKLLFGEWEYQQSGTFDYTHLRWYTQSSMARLLGDCGFVKHVMLADGWIPLPGLRFLVGNKWRSRLNALACHWLPGLFGKQLLFCFSKPIG